jgi:hypothetical protein
MPAFDKIRASDTTFSISVDGLPILGSLSEVESWNVTPIDEITRHRVVGDSQVQVDSAHAGADFTITAFVSEGFWHSNLYEPLRQAYITGRPYPNVTVVIVERFRDFAQTTKIITFGRCAIKLDEEGGSGGDFVKIKFSGTSGAYSVKVA